MKSLKIILLLIVLLATGTGIYIYLGIYNFAADEPHFKITEKAISYLRNRSIEARTLQLQVPQDLGHETRITRGAGNYEAMCAGCHLKPGQKNSEIRKGLYPRPPNLSRYMDDPAEQFWTIKHGIKMSGMPAWGMAGVDDESIWDMVALLQALPGMDAEKYAALVASSEGHHHEDADAHGLETLPITNEGQPELGNVTVVPDDAPADEEGSTDVKPESTDTPDAKEKVSAEPPSPEKNKLE